MTDLEKKKLELEIQSLIKSNRRDRFKFFVDLIQGLSIIVGVIIAINEFVLKDRESENQKSKVTLEYVQKITDKEIVAAKDSLRLYKELCYAMPLEDKREDSLFENISNRFDKGTMNLSHYYNVVHEGIVAGYLDKDICNAFLAYDVRESIDILSELQSRHYGLNSKLITPDYKRFKGLIEFYIDCYKVKGDDLKRVPKYDLDKPIP
jgi:hypothetical protein